MLVLGTGDVSISYANIVDTGGTPVGVSTGVLTAGTVLNGVFTTGFITGVGSQAICYYE
jgi:hypothetical protein